MKLQLEQFANLLKQQLQAETRYKCICCEALGVAVGSGNLENQSLKSVGSGEGLDTVTLSWWPGSPSC